MHLLTPGPTPQHPLVGRAFAQTPLHHRSAAFAEVLGETRANLKRLLNASTQPILLTGSGTTSMEACLHSLLCPGDAVVAVSAGKFGTRWANLADSYGARVHRVTAGAGESPDPDAIADELTRYPSVKALLVTAVETSTGALADLDTIAQVVSAHDDVLFCVDGISWIGAHRCDATRLGIDLLVGASQKAFGLPVGLGFIAASSKALACFEAQERSPAATFDLMAEYFAQNEGGFQFSAPTQLVVALRDVLAWFEGLPEGTSSIAMQCQSLAEVTRVALRALGLRTFAQSPASSLTAIASDDDVDLHQVKQRLENDCKIRVAGGQGALRGQIIRIGHMGYTDQVALRDCLVALAKILAKDEEQMQEILSDSFQSSPCAFAVEAYI